MFKTGRKQAIFFSNNCYFFQNPYNIELTRLLHSKGYRIVFCMEKQVFPVSKEFINWKFIVNDHIPPIKVLEEPEHVDVAVAVLVEDGWIDTI